MLKRWSFVIPIVALLALVASPMIASGNTAPEPPGPSIQAAETNLLVNGNMDQIGFYWRYPNHFVARGWFEWWAGPNQPEFLDGGIIYHNVCYPQPAHGICVDDYHNSSQGYIRWGGAYIAGIYQLVPATACTNYRFTAYVRNDNVNYHPKVGIDPKGTQLPFPAVDNTSHNCPPNNNSPCPSPALHSVNDLPQTIVWAPEYNPPPTTWISMTMTAEALSNTIGVWTFTAPDEATSGGPSRSTYWDEASLVQVPPPSGALLSGALPSPDGSIVNVVTSTTAIRVNLSWQTSQPAVTQVLYHYVSDPSQPIVTNTGSYEIQGAINSTPATNHSTSLGNLRPLSVYDYAILSRKLVGGNCQTSVVTGRLNTTDVLLPQGALPQPSSDIVGPEVLPFDTSAYVIWQSAKPSYAQVLYHHVVTPTAHFTATNKLYLPLISTAVSGDSTSYYELRTAPVFTATTLHIVKLDGLQRNNLYTAVALSAWSEGDTDKSAVSSRMAFSTSGATGSMVLSGVREDQLVEQLQACLADKPLHTCVDELAR